MAFCGMAESLTVLCCFTAFREKAKKEEKAKETVKEEAKAE